MHPSAEAIGLAPALAVGLAARSYRGSPVSRARLAAGALGVAPRLRRVRHAARAAREPHVPLGAPAAERRPRGVGAGAARARDPAAARRAGGRIPALPARSSRCRSGSPRTTRGTCPGSTTRRSAIRTRCSTSSTSPTSRRASASGGRSCTAGSSAGAKAAYLFAAFVLASPLGLLMALIPRAIYPFYVHAPRTWGPGPLADQQIAGVTMAAEEAIVFFGAFTAYLLRFLADEQASGRQPRARRHEQPTLGRLAFAQLPAPLGLGIDLGAEEQRDRGEPQPGEHDDHGGERPPGLVVRPEARRCRTRRRPRRRARRRSRGPSRA